MLNLIQHPSGRKRGGLNRDPTAKFAPMLQSTVLAVKWTLNQVQGDEVLLEMPVTANACRSECHKAFDSALISVFRIWSFSE